MSKRTTGPWHSWRCQSARARCIMNRHGLKPPFSGKHNLTGGGGFGNRQDGHRARLEPTTVQSIIAALCLIELSGRRTAVATSQPAAGIGLARRKNIAPETITHSFFFRYSDIPDIPPLKYWCPLSPPDLERKTNKLRNCESKSCAWCQERRELQ